jgi:hypothetical protein
MKQAGKTSRNGERTGTGVSLNRTEAKLYAINEVREAKSKR